MLMANHAARAIVRLWCLVARPAPLRSVPAGIASAYAMRPFQGPPRGSCFRRQTRSLLGRMRSSVVAPIPGEPGARFVAKPIVSSKVVQTTKAIVGDWELPPFAGARRNPRKYAVRRALRAKGVWRRARPGGECNEPRGSGPGTVR
jgi:hypothetical protein